jgi:hypothetical protein
VFVAGFRPCLYAGGEIRLNKVFSMSPTHSRAAVCVAEDERVFVFDLSWELLSEHFADLDMAPVKWYGSIDEAIVTTTMELRDKVSR